MIAVWCYNPNKARCGFDAYNDFPVIRRQWLSCYGLGKRQVVKQPNLDLENQTNRIMSVGFDFTRRRTAYHVSL